MNWALIFTCLIYGSLFALYNVASGVIVLGAWPDNFTWLKLGASGVLALVLGVFTFMRDPTAAWRSGPGGTKP